MDAIEARLEAAEFEALWLQVRYHEGGVTVVQVKEAIARVNELRRVARGLAGLRRKGGVFPWRELRPGVPAGN